MLSILVDIAHNSSIYFHPLSFQESLPFPLNLSLPFKILISVILILILSFGSKLRVIIFSYLKAPDTKMGPINYLIWIDQANGLFLGVSISYKLIAINCPFPLREMFGETFCEWIDLPGCVYLAGSNIWSSIIAGNICCVMIHHCWYVT